MMKILITGANGLLGQHLVKHLLQSGHQVIATSKGPSRLPEFDAGKNLQYKSIDIKDDFELWDYFTETGGVDTLVHAAAMTQVDACEQDQDACFDCNFEGTTHALVCAEEYCKHFIYVSTDFVFDGSAGNYREEDETGPVNWYGQTKLHAESMVRDSSMPWAIVRTCLVYGNSLQGTRNNIITWVKENLEQHKKIKVVSDQVRTPTYVEDLAKGIALIIDKQETGVFHISGKDVLTPYEMAIQTAEYFKLDKNLIERVDASTFTQPAMRPLKTGFVIDKARKLLGYDPLSFEEGLGRMFGV